MLLSQDFEAPAVLSAMTIGGTKARTELGPVRSQLLLVLDLVDDYFRSITDERDPHIRGVASPLPIFLVIEREGLN